jgi:hypothetical protein
MKKLLYILITCVGLSACNDFLDEPVTDFRTLDNILDTKEGAGAFVGSLKSPFKDYQYYGANYHQMLGFNSGIVGRRAGANKFSPYYKMAQTYTSPIMENLYGLPYEGIAASNIMLSFVDSTLTNVIGIAKFTRAVHYFNLARLFGRVPIVTEPLGDNPAIPRAETVEEVYDLIEKDLLDAFDLLQEVQVDRTNPSKWAAKAFLAKMYLQKASNSLAAGVGTGNAELWTKARDYAMEVIDSSQYVLEGEYKNLFGVNNGFSEESIFEIAFANNIDAGSALHLMYGKFNDKLAWNSGSAGVWGRVVVLRETYDRMLAACGGTMDDRMEAALGFNWDRINNASSVYCYPATVGQQKGYYQAYPAIAKYVDKLAYDKNNGGNNLIVCRLAEMHLIAAEAMNELGDQAGAYAILQPILARGGSGHYSASLPVELTDQKAMLDFIMAQRLVELIGEFHEWFDARRRGATYFKEICENHNTRLDIAKNNYIKDALDKKVYLTGFKGGNDFYFPADDASVEKNLLLPIPFAVMQKNSAITEADQNPGY